jgi:hypothetical protein
LFNAGSSLAAELQRQLAQRQQAAYPYPLPAAALAGAGRVPGPLLLPQRDLLGRRIATNTSNTPSPAARKIAFAAPSGIGSQMPGGPATGAELAAPLPLSARGFMHITSL